MSQYPIAVIVGSLRKDSHNRRLATALARLFPADFELTQLDIGNLPLYDQDNDGALAPVVEAFKARVAAAKGVLVVTPEYNRSMPGVLKNALDVGSRPYGKSAWKGKPVGVIGASPGPIGTAMAQQHLRNVLAFLDMPTLNQPEAYIQVKEGLFDEAGNIGPASKDFLQGWVNAYVAWVKKHS